MLGEELSIWGSISLFFLNFKNFFGKVFGFVAEYRGWSFFMVLIFLSLLFNVADTIKQPTEKTKYFLIHFGEPVTAADYKNMKFADTMASLSDEFGEKTVKEKIIMGFFIIGNILKILFNTLFYIWFFIAMISLFQFIFEKAETQRINLLSISLGLFISLLLIMCGNLLLDHYYKEQLDPEFEKYLDSSFFLPYKGTIRIFTGSWDMSSDIIKGFVKKEVPTYVNVGAINSTI